MFGYDNIRIEAGHTDRLVAAGYAHVIGDVRGSGDSSGSPAGFAGLRQAVSAGAPPASPHKLRYRCHGSKPDYQCGSLPQAKHTSSPVFSIGMPVARPLIGIFMPRI